MASLLRLGLMALGAAAATGGVGYSVYQSGPLMPKINRPELVSNAAMPWYVALKISKPGVGTELCGGVLLARNVVLTAAHCVDAVVGIADNVRAFQGDGSLAALSAIRASRIVLHPLWSQPERVDAALVFLDREMVGGRAVKLRAVADVPAPGYAVLTGRGLMTDNIKASTVGYARLHVSEWQDCRNYWPELATPSTICSVDSINGSCAGDSGGPLVMGSYQDVQVIGIVLGGPDLCGQTARPNEFASVFTRSSAIAGFVADALPGLEVTTTAPPGPLFTPPKTNEI